MLDPVIEEQPTTLEPKSNPLDISIIQYPFTKNSQIKIPFIPNPRQSRLH